MPATPFKVRCLDDTGDVAKGHLTKGQIYTVISEYNEDYRLQETTPYSFLKTRFQVVEENTQASKYPPVPFQVRCISNKDTKHIHVGQEYTVIEINHNGNLVLQGLEDSGGWFPYRFEVITSPTVTTKTVDVEEERLWKLFRPRLGPGECPCGIAKVKCQFHRD